jgi:hypothetical protein
MNITEQRAIVDANLHTFLHGSEDASNNANQVIAGTIDSQETYLYLLTRFLGVARKSIHTLSPVGAALVAGDHAFFVLRPHDDGAHSRRVAVQLINTYANGDDATCSTLIRDAIANGTPQDLGDLLYDVAQYARSLHLQVCAG